MQFTEGKSSWRVSAFPLPVRFQNNREKEDWKSILYSAFLALNSCHLLCFATAVGKLTLHIRSC